MIHNFVVDYNKTTKINNIEFANPEKISVFTQKMRFYNPDISEPLHKFWYFIPNAKLIKKGQGLLTIVLSSSDTNLIESLKSLDEKTDHIIKKIIPGKPISPTIKISSNFPPVLEVNVDTESKCYDQENAVTNYMSIKNNAKIQLYMEFDSVVSGADRCERKWRVIQLKENKPIDLNANMFDIVAQTQQHTTNVMNTFYPSPISHPVHLASSYSMNPYNPVPVQQMSVAPYHLSHGLHIPPAPPPPPLSSLYSPPPLREEKQNSVGGTLFQPPTQDQLMSMIGKLKKPKINDSKKPQNESVLAKDRIDQSFSHSQSVLQKEDEHISNIPEAPPLNFVQESETEQKHFVHDAHYKGSETKAVEAVKTNVIKYVINDDNKYRMNLSKKILSLIEEQSDRLEKDNAKFANDVAKANKIMDLIEILIKQKQTRVSQSMNESMISDQESIKSTRTNKHPDQITMNTDSINTKKMAHNKSFKSISVINPESEDDSEEDPFAMNPKSTKLENVVQNKQNLVTEQQLK